jgi:hypothetical protein
MKAMQEAAAKHRYLQQLEDLARHCVRHLSWP